MATASTPRSCAARTCGPTAPPSSIGPSTAIVGSKLAEARGRRDDEVHAGGDAEAAGVEQQVVVPERLPLGLEQVLDVAGALAVGLVDAPLGRRPVQPFPPHRRLDPPGQRGI